MPAASPVPDQTVLGATVVARLSTDEALAHRILDALAEAFDSPDTAVSAHEEAAGGWAVTIHFRDAPNETALRALVALAAGAQAANTLVLGTVAPRDWVKASLQGLRPVAAGRLLVYGAHDRGRVPVNSIAIEIEAALAFGTGHHGTTRGCLLALDRILKARRPRRILDVGTGSGVLAIAAAKSLHRHVLASDIDTSAVHIARANARLNHVAGLIEIVPAAGLSARHFRARAPFDLVFANILLAPIKRFAAPMARLLSAEARLVLSGLLTTQASSALATYRAQGLALERRIHLEGWATLVLRRSARGVAARRRAE
jgi:ribosomal protein L11 methyltransferase